METTKGCLRYGRSTLRTPVAQRRALAQRLCREIIVWKHLSHPNILPLVGVSISGGPHRFRILTEWTHNGNIVKYTQSNPAANRLQLVSPLTISCSFFS